MNTIPYQRRFIRQVVPAWNVSIINSYCCYVAVSA